MAYEQVIDMGYSALERDAMAEELTTRAIETIYPSPEWLQEELVSGRRLTAYLGIDPTAPELHVGHESQLLKLHNLQQLGHHVILLIGDFTAMIGDPSDKSAARVKLTREQVLANARSYREQAGKILDFEHPTNPIEMRYNSEWLGKMDFADVLELASEFTVSQMLERDMFKKRLSANKPVGLHEFLYPMMQGWDSVAMGVDIEVGGSDQIFNMLVGSTLIRRHLDKQKFVMAGKLLVDPSGRKIGKTEGNMITLIDKPQDMFHKVMLWGDGITPHALELCTNMPMGDIRSIEADLASGALSGLDGKKLLARRIVTDLYDAETAKEAEATYETITAKRGEVDIADMITESVVVDEGIIAVLTRSGLAKSNSEARRLVTGGAVRINEKKVDDSWVMPNTSEGLVLQVGKKKLENYRKLTNPVRETK